MSNSTTEAFVLSTYDSVDYRFLADFLFKYQYSKAKNDDAYIDSLSEQSISSVGAISTTSNFESSRVPLLFEQNATNNVLKKLKNKRTTAVDHITPAITKCLVDYCYDDDSMEAIWRRVDEILSEFPIDILGEALQRLYVSHNDFPNVLSGICRVLMGFELEEVSPWGPIMLAGLLNHSNETVKEHAVMLLENWCDKTLLPILRNLDCHSEWLRDYIKSVVTYLEG